MCVMVLKSLHKIALTNAAVLALCLSVFSGQAVLAETRLYQYDGKLPFVQMMLNMMVAMGVLDKLPAHGAYGGYGNTASPWSRYNPYSHSSWRQPFPGGVNTIWGNPDWGVLPMDGYSYQRYSPYGSRWPGSGWSGSRWSAADLSGWVNEAWETSDWNPAAEKQARSTSPEVQDKPGIKNIKQKNQQPLKNKSITQSKKLQGYEKPCITEFCGLKRPDLNGLWLTQTGEMLGIKSQRYLWSDGASRYLTGRLKIQNEYLLTSIDGHEKIMPFKYKVAGNHLLTMQPNGKIREFMRSSAAQAYRQYPVYDSGYASGYVLDHGSY